jgi:hypothetical protein
MSSEESPQQHTDEGAESSTEPAAEAGRVPTDESEAEREGEKVVSGEGEAHPVELSQPIDDARPRESLDLEGSDLEAEMDQVSCNVTEWSCPIDVRCREMASLGSARLGRELSVSWTQC